MINSQARRHPPSNGGRAGSCLPTRRHEYWQAILQAITPEDLAIGLGATGQFVSIDAPGWGTVWFRVAKIRQVIEMTSSHLRLSGSASFGARVLFDHDPEPSGESFVPNLGFSLYGLTAEQVSTLLGQS